MGLGDIFITPWIEGLGLLALISGGSAGSPTKNSNDVENGGIMGCLAGSVEEHVTHATVNLGVVSSNTILDVEIIKRKK